MGCTGPEITHSRSGKAAWPWRWPQEGPRGFVTVEVPSSVFHTGLKGEPHPHRLSRPGASFLLLRNQRASPTGWNSHPQLGGDAADGAGALCPRPPT